MIDGPPIFLMIRLIEMYWAHVAVSQCDMDPIEAAYHADAQRALLKVLARGEG